MKKKIKLSQKGNAGCKLFFVLVFNIISIMWIIGSVFSFNSSRSNLVLQVNTEEIKAVNFKFSNHRKKTIGDKSGMSTLYLLDGKNPISNKPLTVKVSSDEISYSSIQKIISQQEAKIWIFEKEKSTYAVLQSVYPTKKDLLNHSLVGLLITFFIPLLLLIRLLYLYGNKTIKFIKETITAMKNMERIILLLFLFPLGLSA